MTAGGGEGVLYAALSPVREARGRITIGRALEAYTEYLRQKGYSSHTIRGARNFTSAFYRASGLGPAFPLADVTSEIGERVLRKFRSRYAPQTVHRYGSFLLQLFRAFVAGGLILTNPFATLDPPPKPKLLPGPVLTPEEVELLFAAARVPIPSGIRNRAMLELLYSTGLRLQECANLEVGDIDFGKGTLHVRGWPRIN